MDKEPNLPEFVETNKVVDDLIRQKVDETDNVKTALDLMFTHDALQDKATFDSALKEKQEEIKFDAEKRKIQAETEKISKEVEKIKQEKEKELAELDKQINAKKKEVEQLELEGNKAETFFKSNKDILKYIGVREQKSIGVMQALMIPATIIFIIVQVLLFPFTFLRILLETLVGILGGICGAIKNNAIKIILSVLVLALLIGGGFCAYYFGYKMIL